MNIVATLLHRSKGTVAGHFTRNRQEGFGQFYHLLILFINAGKHFPTYFLTSTMDRIRIKVQKNTELINFEIVDYIHHEHNHCKFEVFKGEELVASFEPDQYGYLQICKNPGKLDRELLHELAEKIESFNLSGN